MSPRGLVLLMLPSQFENTNEQEELNFPPHGLKENGCSQWQFSLKLLGYFDK